MNKNNDATKTLPSVNLHNQHETTMADLALPAKVIESYNAKTKSHESLNMNNSLKYTDFCKLSLVKVI